jgi:hypothetical protein
MSAWFCQEDGTYPHVNGFIVFWDGTIKSKVYTSLGATAAHVNPSNYLKSMLLSSDGTTLIYETTNETASVFSSESGAPHTQLYAMTLNPHNDTASSPVALDSGSGNNIGDVDRNGNGLSFINGQADVVYNVSTDDGASNSVWKVPVSGGSPTELMASSGGDSWQVIGSADASGNSFVCEQTDSSHIVVQVRICSSNGTPGATLTLPDTAAGESLVGYSSTK